MKKIEAPTLQEAYTKAADELQCSITELDFEIIQNPSDGFFGFFKKNAIIVAKCKTKQKQKQQKNSFEPREKQKKFKSEKKQLQSQPKEPKIVQEQPKEQPQPEPREQKPKRNSFVDDMINDFHAQTQSKEEIVEEIAKELKELFSHSCYNIEVSEVSIYDEKTILVKFEGEDAALLIGKEGYRYKALSYMLFNWINQKYHFLLRLEIAEFLQIQEEQIKRYLEPIKESIYKFGKGQTKPLDGVLVQIALKELRAEFPDKYVAIKTNANNEKYIIVNEFNQPQ